MSRLTAAATLLALLAAPIVAIAPAVTADAATVAHENVLRGWCHVSRGDHRTYTRECMLDADDDTGRIAYVDRRGHRHVFHDGARFLASVRHHAPYCREEDSPRCYWDASEAGNGVGESFIVVGGRAEGTGQTIYLELF